MSQTPRKKTKDKMLVDEKEAENENDDNGEVFYDLLQTSTARSDNTSTLDDANDVLFVRRNSNGKSAKTYHMNDVSNNNNGHNSKSKHMKTNTEETGMNLWDSQSQRGGSIVGGDTYSQAARSIVSPPMSIAEGNEYSQVSYYQTGQSNQSYQSESESNYTDNMTAIIHNNDDASIVDANTIANTQANAVANSLDYYQNENYHNNNDDNNNNNNNNNNNHNNGNNNNTYDGDNNNNNNNNINDLSEMDGALNPLTPQLQDLGTMVVHSQDSGSDDNNDDNNNSDNNIMASSSKKKMRNVKRASQSKSKAPQSSMIASLTNTINNIGSPQPQINYDSHFHNGNNNNNNSAPNTHSNNLNVVNDSEMDIASYGTVKSSLMTTILDTTAAPIVRPTSALTPTHHDMGNTFDSVAMSNLEDVYVQAMLEKNQKQQLEKQNSLKNTNNNNNNNNQQLQQLNVNTFLQMGGALTDNDSMSPDGPPHALTSKSDHHHKFGYRSNGAPISLTANNSPMISIPNNNNNNGHSLNTHNKQGHRMKDDNRSKNSLQYSASDEGIESEVSSLSGKPNNNNNNFNKQRRLSQLTQENLTKMEMNDHGNGIYSDIEYIRRNRGLSQPPQAVHRHGHQQQYHHQPLQHYQMQHVSPNTHLMHYNNNNNNNTSSFAAYTNHYHNNHNNNNNNNNLLQGKPISGTSSNASSEERRRRLLIRHHGSIESRSRSPGLASVSEEENNGWRRNKNGGSKNSSNNTLPRTITTLGAASSTNGIGMISHPGFFKNSGLTTIAASPSPHAMQLHQQQQQQQQQQQMMMMNTMHHNNDNDGRSGSRQGMTMTASEKKKQEIIKYAAIAATVGVVIVIGVVLGKKLFGSSQNDDYGGHRYGTRLRRAPRRYY